MGARKAIALSSNRTFLSTVASRRDAIALAMAALGIGAARSALAATDVLVLPVFTLKPFTLQPIVGLDGIEAPTLDTLMGQVSVLNFWGAWCPACRNEHEALLKLRQEGMRLIGINYNDTDEKAANYLAQAGNPFQFVGKDQKKGGLIEMLGVDSYPQTFVVGKKADVLWQATGTLNDLELDDIRKAVADAKAEKD